MIKYLWQLPQNLLGLLVRAMVKAEKAEAYGITFYNSYGSPFGVSLGNYIIIRGFWSERDLLHERGHQKQSLYLGPLYLIVIGLPSAIGNLINRFIDFDYYKQPWEAWADKLGGVRR